MSFPNDVKSIIFFGKSNLKLYFSAIPYSFTPDSLQVPYSLSPDWVLIGHYIFNLTTFFHAFDWTGETNGEDEALCVLANLVSMNAVKGYISWKHKKLVFAKSGAFQPPSKWTSVGAI